MLASKVESDMSFKDLKSEAITSSKVEGLSKLPKAVGTDADAVSVPTGNETGSRSLSSSLQICGLLSARDLVDSGVVVVALPEKNNGETRIRE